MTDHEQDMKRFAKVVMRGILEGELTYPEGLNLMREIDRVMMPEGEMGRYGSSQ